MTNKCIGPDRWVRPKIVGFIVLNQLIVVDTHNHVPVVLRGGFAILAQRQAIVSLVPSASGPTPGRLHTRCHSIPGELYVPPLDARQLIIVVLFLQRHGTSIPSCPFLDLPPCNRYRCPDPRLRAPAAAWLPRIRRMALAFPVRRDTYAHYRNMVLVHDGSLANTDKVMVSAEGLVHRAGGGDHGEPDLEGRSFQGRHA